MSRKARIDRSVLERIHQHARQHYPREACGLLLSRPVRHAAANTSADNDAPLIEQAVIVPNDASPDRQHDRFAIDPRLMLQWDRLASRAGQSIAGIFHSHPDAPSRPSDFDLEAAWPGFVYIIVSLARGMVVSTAAWTLDTDTNTFAEVELDVWVDDPEWVI